MKKLFALIMSVLMIACFMPTMAFATTCENCDHAVAIGETHYDSFEAAIKATSGTVSITLLKDVPDLALTGPSDRMLVIDLNGHTLSGSIEKDHDLKIVDNSAENTGTAVFSFVRCNVLQLSGGNVTINDAQILHTTQIDGKANVTINGGVYQLGGTHQTSVSVADDKTGIITINAGLFWTDINNPELINSQKQEAIACKTYVYDSQGHKVKKDAFTVGAKEKGDCTIEMTRGEKKLYFSNLYAAVTATSDGDVITLLGNQTINRVLYIDESIIIDGQNHNVSVANPIRDFGGEGNYAHGVFEISGDSKTAVIKNVNFSGIDIKTVLIRAYNTGSDSKLAVENCTFTNVKAINVIRASSGSAKQIELTVKGCKFDGCTTLKDGNGIVQIDSSSDNGTSTIENNSFINNSVNPESNAAVIYLSAPGKVKGNYFENNTTTAKADDNNTKNGIVVTGSNAGGSIIESNAFVSHTFVNGTEQGAVYGAKGETKVDKNYYGTGIDHLAKAGEGFKEGTVATRYSENSSGTGATTGTGSTSSGGSYRETPLEKAKKEANTAISAAASANKYDDAEQAEVKAILDKAAADIKNAKTEEEVKAIKEAAQAEIDKVLTTEEKAQVASVGSVDKDIFKAKSKYSKLNGKKAIKVTWNVPEGMKLDGFEVFRSTKKYSGFGKTPYFTTTNTSYTNNKDLVAGKTYYYKVRGFVEINGERYYTGFSTKAFRTIK